MFIRQKKNKSGSVSVQIISKHAGKYKVEKTIGSSSSTEGIDILLHQARHELSKLVAQPSLFISENEASIEGFLYNLSNSNVQTPSRLWRFGDRSRTRPHKVELVYEGNEANRRIFN
jgi:hypothetical protein